MPNSTINILWRIISKAAFKHIYIIYHISYTEEIYVKRCCVGGGYEFSANVDHCRLCKKSYSRSLFSHALRQKTKFPRGPSRRRRRQAEEEKNWKRQFCGEIGGGRGFDQKAGGRVPGAERELLREG